MKIYLGSDHGGEELKNKLIEYLINKGMDAQDIGIPNHPMDDYPEFAFLLGEKVVKTRDALGILICRSGVGMSIAANKVKGIRCVRAISEEDAFKGKSHNGCNVLALGSDITTDFSLACRIVEAFIHTDMPTEERHKIRVNKILTYEENHEY